MAYFRTILGSILLVVIVYFSVEIIRESKVRQKYMSEQAELLSIRHGLLNAYEWKNQLSNVLTDKIRAFNLSEDKREDLRKRIESSMDILLVELEHIIKKKNKNSGLIRNLGTWLIESMFFDIEDLRKKIPEFAELVLVEIDKPESRAKLKMYIDTKLDQFLTESLGKEQNDLVKYIEWKYDCENIATCNTIIQDNLDVEQQDVWQRAAIVLGSFVVILIVLFLFNKNIRRFHFVLILGALVTLLFVGIKTPMIDIDARIGHFEFLFLGTNLTFDNQILFFQSKSIFQVVTILLKTADIQAIGVGILIFIFSIIFPIFKLIMSLFLIYRPKLKKNKFVNYMALKSGKWSMADVFVVAIFMSFIGFRSILKSQLARIADLSNRIEIITTDNSTLDVGFALFLAFVIGSMIFSSLLVKNIQDNE